MPDQKPLHVSILGLPEASHATVAGLSETLNVFAMLGGVNDAMPSEPPFNALIAGCHNQRGGEATPFRTQVDINEIERTDIIIIPALEVSPFDWQPGGTPDLVAWLQAMHKKGARLCSTCSGALLLAQTGLLDRYKATTHWAYAALFKQRFPRIDLCDEKLLINTGANNNILMSGGAGSWHDLALYLIAEHVGLAAAQTIAKFLLLEWHTDGQLPYNIFMPRKEHGDAIVLQAQNWLEKNLCRAQPVECMTSNSGLSERTFKRRFVQATGLTPIRYVQKSRIEAAKIKLEQTTMAIDEIAWQVGYSDPAFFRRLFKRINGITASAHRRKMQIPKAHTSLI